MQTAVLAYRSLSRQRRRTAASLSAIAFGVAALILAAGFIEWNLRFGRETTIHSQLGHLQAFRPGYLELGQADPFAYLLPDNDVQMARVRSMPHVMVVAPRLALSGLASHGETTLSFIGEGVDPLSERELSRSMRIVAGNGLAPEEERGVLIGQGLASNLGVKPGDTLVLMASTRNGGVNAVETRVRGLFATITKAYDDVAIRLPIKLARELLKTRGAHTWVVLLDDTGRTDAALVAMGAEFSSLGLEWVPWHRLADFYNKTSALFAKQVGVIKIIIAVIIILSISNTMMMAVMERVSEIGTVMALGNRRSRVLEMFLLEGLFLGIAGGLIGVVVGVLLAGLLSWIGIPMPPGPGMTWGFDAGILVTIPMALEAFVLAVVTTLLATIYPAWRASRLEIVDALRQGQ